MADRDRTLAFSGDYLRSLSNIYRSEANAVDFSREETGSAPRSGNDNYSNRGNYQSFDNASGASAFSELDDTEGELPF